jgi:hypothetical protein
MAGEVKIQSKDFQHILRIMGTNVTGVRHVPVSRAALLLPFAFCARTSLYSPAACRGALDHCGRARQRPPQP